MSLADQITLLCNLGHMPHMAHSVQNSSIVEWGCRGEGDDGLVSGLQLTKGPFNLHCTPVSPHCIARKPERERGHMSHIQAACLVTACLPLIWYLQIAPSDQVTILQPVSAQSDRIHITHCTLQGGGKRRRRFNRRDISHKLRLCKLLGKV